jgi:hypothetical protein
MLASAGVLLAVTGGVAACGGEADDAGGSAGERSGIAGPPGPVCGDKRILGWRVTSPPQENDACVVSAPVQVVSVAGVALDPATLLDCSAAEALAELADDTIRPAARDHLDAEVTSMRVFAGFVCRGVNGRPGAKLSEHAFGRAVDVGSFHLADGRDVTVTGGWNGPADEAAFLRDVWDDACGVFTTVLGPEANSYHYDHFHFDMAKRKHSAWCE